MIRKNFVNTATNIIVVATLVMIIGALLLSMLILGFYILTLGHATVVLKIPSFFIHYWIAGSILLVIFSHVSFKFTQSKNQKAWLTIRGYKVTKLGLLQFLRYFVTTYLAVQIVCLIIAFLFYHGRESIDNQIIYQDIDEYAVVINEVMPYAKDCYYESGQQNCENADVKEKIDEITTNREIDDSYFHYAFVRIDEHDRLEYLSAVTGKISFYNQNDFIFNSIYANSGKNIQNALLGEPRSCIQESSFCGSLTRFLFKHSYGRHIPIYMVLEDGTGAVFRLENKYYIRNYFGLSFTISMVSPIFIYLSCMYNKLFFSKMSQK